jgi:lipopolysaccharide export system permease protein
MGLLQRHLFASVLAVTAVAVGLLALVLVAGAALRDLLGLVVAGRLELAQVAQLLAWSVPTVIAYALPMGLLTACLLVLGRKSSDGEITAMRAAGLSVAWVARPVLVLGLLATVACLWFNFQVMPQARVAYRTLLLDAVKQNPLNFIVARTFVRDFPGMIVYVGEKHGAQLREVWVWQLDAQQRVVRLARSSGGEIGFRDADDTLLLALRNASLEERDRKTPEEFAGKPSPVAGAERVEFSLALDRVFGSAQFKPKLKWNTLGQLLARRATIVADGTLSPEARQAQTRQIDAILHDKTAASFGPLALALLAVPLGIRVSRKETTANFAVALALVLSYYFLINVHEWLDGAAWGLRLVAIWFPPVLFMGLGLWLLRRLDRT